MTIGETLRSAREAKGFSVQDVVTATRMSVRQVEDMEADDFSSFAYPFYAKVFLRQFARAVGLDPAPLVARWAAESGASGAASESRSPIVPLETIDDESGGLRVVKPDVPQHSRGQEGEDRASRRHERPEKRVAPAPEPPPKEDSPRPEKRAAAADPEVAAAAAQAAAVPEGVPSVPLAQKQPADALPVKRVAEVRPGDVPPEPVSMRAPEAVAAREIRPALDLPPVVKKVPVDPDNDARAVNPSAPATVPDFIESSAPAFVFPGAALPAAVSPAPSPSMISVSPVRQSSYLVPRGMLWAALQQTPLSEQFSQPRGAPLYPVATMVSFLMMTEPQCLRRQVDLSATAFAIPR